MTASISYRNYVIYAIIAMVGVFVITQPVFAGACEDKQAACVKKEAEKCPKPVKLECAEAALKNASCQKALEECNAAATSASKEETTSDSGSSLGDYGLKETADAAKIPNTESGVPQLVGKIIQAALSLVATIFFFLMVYGGFLWMTARGNTDQISKAKDLITQAIVGVAVISAAWAITSFVISRIG